MAASRCRCSAAWAGLALALAGCATPIDNAPLNAPITAAALARATIPRDIVGSNVVALSLSGGGMRAAAFGHGVMQALAAEGGSSRDEARDDVYGDLTFISAVSGGSLAAAFHALHGRGALQRFRSEVLARNLERDLRLSLLSPVNLGRLLAGGLNDRSNLAAILDAEVFGGATFADLYRARKPDVWINATDIYNRTPFPFVPPVFEGLCSDLSQLRVSEAVAASMAVPLAFAPVVLRTYPEACLTPVPPWADESLDDAGSVAAGTVAATARAVRAYRDPKRMRYVKLADGGLTDNQGLASILIARAVSGDAHGPLTAADAVRLSRLLFLIVDAGRPPNGDWALEAGGPGGVEAALAAADSAIDSATRFSAAAFRTMFEQWRESIVRFRCALPAAEVRRHLDAEALSRWRCDDVRFYLDVIGFGRLPRDRAERMRRMETRLSLSPDDVEAAVAAGRDAALASPALGRYRSERAR